MKRFAIMLAGAILLLPSPVAAGPEDAEPRVPTALDLSALTTQAEFLLYVTDIYEGQVVMAGLGEAGDRSVEAEPRAA